MVDRAVGIGIDAVLGRVDGIFQRVQAGQTNSNRAAIEAIPAASRRASYKCALCKKDFAIDDLAKIEMVAVNPHATGWATCANCYKLMWNTVDEKRMLFGAKLGDKFAALVKEAKAKLEAEQAQAQQAAPGAQQRTPWSVLGVERNASSEEVGKAYKSLAKIWHPDKFVSGPENTRELDVAIARKRFDEIQRAYESMMKVRKVAT